MLLVPAVGGHLADVDVAFAPAFGQQLGGPRVSAVELQHLLADEDGLVEVAAVTGAQRTAQHGVDAVAFELQAEVAQLFAAVGGGAVAVGGVDAVLAFATGAGVSQQHLDLAGGGGATRIAERQALDAH